MYKVANKAKSLLFAPITNLQTTLDITPGTRNLFPPDYPFRLIIEEKTGDRVDKAEIVEVTGSPSTDRFTITRAVEECPVSDSSTSQAQIAQEFESGAFISLIFTADMFEYLRDTFLAKSGVRTSMLTTQNITATNGSPNITVFSTDGWFPGMLITGTGIPNGTTVVSFVPDTSAVLSANFTGTSGTVEVTARRLHELEFSTTGQEILRPKGVSTTILASESIRKRKSNGAYDEVFWSDILATLQSTLGEVSTEFAGETIATGNVLANEYVRMGVTQFLRFGELSSNERRGFVFIYSGTSGDVRFFMGRSTAFTENITVRFYTNNNGVPGTLIDTQVVSSANLNPSGTADTTWLVSVTPNLTSRIAGDEIFVEVLRAGSLNSTNFFYLGATNVVTSVYFKHYIFNGTSWSGATFNHVPVFGNSVVTNMAIAFNSTITSRNTGLGVASSGGTVGQAISTVKRGLATIAGIVNGQAYKTLGNGTLTPILGNEAPLALGYATNKLLIPFTVGKYIAYVYTGIGTLNIPVRSGDMVMVYGRHTAGSGGGVVNTSATGPGISLAWAPGFTTYDFNGAGVANASGTLTIQQGSFPGSTVTVNAVVFLMK